MSIQLAKKMKSLIFHTLMIAFSLMMLYPLIWMITSSFKEDALIMRTTTQLIPSNPTLVNYANAWKGFGKNTFMDFFSNSMTVAVGRMIGMTASSALAAFGFARIRFKTKNIWFVMMIGTMCLPSMVLQIPQYVMFNKLGWIGTFKPIIVPAFFGGAYNIFLIMQFMRGIPRDMDEAAEIDGCGWWGIFTKIMLPLVSPALVMVAVLVFIAAWGDFYSALIYLNKPSTYPIAYALKLYSDEASTNYGSMLAMSVMSIVPIMILFALFQKSLMEGITTTGIKG